MLHNSTKKSAKIIHMYHTYNVVMSTIKRIPVSETVWKDLAEMRSAGQTYSDLLTEMIEEKKKRRLEQDIMSWKNRPKEGFVPLDEIH